MALTLIQPNEPVKIDAIKLYYYGDPSIGKSSLAMTAPDVLIIDADKGAYRTGPLRRAPIQLAENWFQVNQLTEQDLEPFKVIAIDTVQRLLELIKTFLMNNKSNVKGDGALKLNAQGTANNLFQGFVNRMISYGKDVVFIAHMTEDKDEDQLIKRPDLGGKNRQELYRMSDCMAYLTYQQNNKGGVDRVLKFSQGTNHHAKDCANLGDVIVPDLASNPTFLGDLIQSIKDHLNTMTPEQKEYIEREQDWLHWTKICHEFQYASEFNALTTELLENSEDPMFRQKWDCLRTCAKHLGFTYSKDTKKWAEGEPA